MSEQTEAERLRGEARVLYRRADNMPLSHADGSIGRMAELKERAEALETQAAELEAQRDG